MEVVILSDNNSDIDNKAKGDNLLAIIRKQVVDALKVKTRSSERKYIKESSGVVYIV